MLVHEAQKTYVNDQDLKWVLHFKTVLLLQKCKLTHAFYVPASILRQYILFYSAAERNANICTIPGIEPL